MTSNAASSLTHAPASCIGFPASSDDDASADASSTGTSIGNSSSGSSTSRALLRLAIDA
ncbi:hypothetical protein D3C83_313860 [compost metagenome]